MDEHPWQVLQVNTNCEKKVVQHLAVRSLEHYLPLYSERSRWSDRVVPMERPLFTGYVFVRFSPQARRSVVSTPGVLRLLGSDERYMVSAAEIDRIRKGLASGCLLRPHQGLTVGTQVRVRSGVFEGAEGVVTEMRRQCKVVIAMAAIRQFFSLEVGVGDVEVLKSAVGTPLQELKPARVR
ncbi:MAG: transcription termination/antitermination protein NusG [Terracidiphilus sp.]